MIIPTLYPGHFVFPDSPVCLGRFSKKDPYSICPSVWLLTVSIALLKPVPLPGLADRSGGVKSVVHGLTCVIPHGRYLLELGGEGDKVP